MNKIPLPPRLLTKINEPQEEKYEYNTKEMKPAALILRDLERAHRIFLMHHDVSLSSLFLRLPRHKFGAVLSRYWDLFLSTWNVSLHGNPARDIYQGINIAASGELGVGVGEEERGSGEREVLEGLVGRTEGLIDLVVSKFGGEDEEVTETKRKTSHGASPWLGSGREPSIDDGAIFLGTGAISRKSIRNVTQWMEDLYTWGEHAYGVIDSPISTRKARVKKADSQLNVAKDIEPDTKGQKPKADKQGEDAGKDTQPTAAEKSATTEAPKVAKDPESATDAQTTDQPAGDDGKLDKMVSYLKLGYGQYWTIPGVPGLSGSSTPGHDDSTERASSKQTSSNTPKRPAPPKKTPSQEAAGHYLIGLKGEIEEVDGGDDDGAASDDSDEDYDSRTVLRTLHVELESGHTNHEHVQPETVSESGGESLTERQIRGTMRPGASPQENSKSERLRVVVYVNRPFIFVFLFRLRTDSLAWDALYRSLHYQLSPLRKPLLASTQYRPERPDTGRSGASGIFDLVWNPTDLSLHSTVPNIPDHLYPVDERSSAQRWSRADAVNTHLHILNIYSGTRSRRTTDLERTQKTSRGWWVVWTRLVEREADPRVARQQQQRADTSAANSARDSPSASAPPSPRPDSDAGDEAGLLSLAPLTTSKEIFLIRRASDHASSGTGTLGVGGGGAEAVGRLAQGIGVDTRRYVEDLLSML